MLVIIINVSSMQRNKNKDSNNNDTNGGHSSGRGKRNATTLQARLASLSLDLMDAAAADTIDENTTASIAVKPLADTTNCSTETPQLPYATATSPIYGRYLIAARDLCAGEAVLSQQRPLVIGPCSEPVCLGCYVPLLLPRTKQYKCPGCGWPLCGPKCVGLRQPLGHSTWECSALREKRVADQLERCKGVELEHAYEAIAPLRCLLLRRHDPHGGWAAVQAMESHDGLRSKIAALWERNERVVVQRLRDSWGFGAEFTAADVHTVCGMFEVNCFEIGQNEGRARALYDVAYLLAHDCSANTSHSDAPGTYEMTVRVIRDVPRGEAITLSYAYTLQVRPI